jgi:hypothetical protein
MTDLHCRNPRPSANTSTRFFSAYASSLRTRAIERGHAKFKPGCAAISCRFAPDVCRLLQRQTARTVGARPSGRRHSVLGGSRLARRPHRQPLRHLVDRGCRSCHDAATPNRARRSGAATTDRLRRSPMASPIRSTVDSQKTAPARRILTGTGTADAAALAL